MDLETEIKMESDNYETGWCLNKRYRVFNRITLMDGGSEVKGYGEYTDHLTKNRGVIDSDSWEEVTKLWTPTTRIFARLPISKEDYSKILEGNKPYLSVDKYTIKKIEEPDLGYGQNDDWFFYRFHNLGKKEVREQITWLIEWGCQANKIPIGLELKISEQYLEKVKKIKNREIKAKVNSLLMKE